MTRRRLLRRHGDGSHDEKDHGNWARGGSADEFTHGIAGRDLPPEPGTAAIPESAPDTAVRLYHYTRDEESLRSILSEGLRLDRARGETYGEPNLVWASATKPGDGRHYVEFWADPYDASIGDPWTHDRAEFDPREWEKAGNNIAFGTDIPASRILSYNEPWHRSLRYLREEYPDGVPEWAVSGLEDDPTVGPAIERLRIIKGDLGTRHAPGQHDQKTHGNWARGTSARPRPADWVIGDDPRNDPLHRDEPDPEEREWELGQLTISGLDYMEPTDKGVQGNHHADFAGQPTLFRGFEVEYREGWDYYEPQSGNYAGWFAASEWGAWELAKELGFADLMPAVTIVMPNDGSGIIDPDGRELFGTVQEYDPGVPGHLADDLGIDSFFTTDAMFETIRRARGSARAAVFDFLINNTDRHTQNFALVPVEDFTVPDAQLTIPGLEIDLPEPHVGGSFEVRLFDNSSAFSPSPAPRSVIMEAWKGIDLTDQFDFEELRETAWSSAIEDLFIDMLDVSETLGDDGRSHYGDEGYERFMERLDWLVEHGRIPSDDTTFLRSDNRVQRMIYRHAPGQHDQKSHGNWARGVKKDQDHPIWRDDEQLDRPSPEEREQALRDKIEAAGYKLDGWPKPTSEGVQGNAFVEFNGEKALMRGYTVYPDNKPTLENAEHFVVREWLAWELAKELGVADLMPAVILFTPEGRGIEDPSGMRMFGTVQEYDPDVPGNLGDDLGFWPFMGGWEEKLRGVAGSKRSGVYDFLIGNGDRHDQNFAVKDGMIRLFDNSSAFIWPGKPGMTTWAWRGHDLTEDYDLDALMDAAGGGRVWEAFNKAVDALIENGMSRDDATRTMNDAFSTFITRAQYLYEYGSIPER